MTNQALPGLDPALPATTRDKALALLACTRRAIALRAELRAVEAEARRLSAALEQ
mgnify:CR=1 FL=1